MRLPLLHFRGKCYIDGAKVLENIFYFSNEAWHAERKPYSQFTMTLFHETPTQIILKLERGNPLEAHPTYFPVVYPPKLPPPVPQPATWNPK